MLYRFAVQINLRAHCFLGFLSFPSHWTGQVWVLSHNRREMVKTQNPLPSIALHKLVRRVSNLKGDRLDYLPRSVSLWRLNKIKRKKNQEDEDGSEEDVLNICALYSTLVRLDLASYVRVRYANPFNWWFAAVIYGGKLCV